MNSPVRLVQLPEERVKGRRWMIYVCAEPDGQDCDSGTHPNILSHKCGALKRWHEWHEAADDGTVDCDVEDEPKGPMMAMVEVAAVNPEGVTDAETELARE